MNKKQTPGALKFGPEISKLITLTSKDICEDIRVNFDFARFYKMRNIPHGSCRLGVVRTDWNGAKIYHVFLYSYTTIVCGFTIVDDDTVLAFCTGTYSQTTRKHINRFCHEIYDNVSYYWFKDIAHLSNKAVWLTDSAEIAKQIVRNTNKYMGG